MILFFNNFLSAGERSFSLGIEKTSLLHHLVALYLRNRVIALKRTALYRNHSLNPKLPTYFLLEYLKFLRGEGTQQSKQSIILGLHSTPGTSLSYVRFLGLLSTVGFTSISHY